MWLHFSLVNSVLLGGLCFLRNEEKITGSCLVAPSSVSRAESWYLWLDPISPPCLLSPWLFDSPTKSPLASVGLSPAARCSQGAPRGSRLCSLCSRSRRPCSVFPSASFWSTSWERGEDRALRDSRMGVGALSLFIYIFCLLGVLYL